MTGEPRVLVVQHQGDCPPGLIGLWLDAAGCELDLRHPYAGEPVPTDLRDHDALLVLGGSMGAHDDAEHPWLAPTKDLVRTAARDGVPMLGICLGHQLAAVALGGSVEVNRRTALAGSHERVLLGAGDPDTCRDAVAFAFREAEARGCELDVVRTWRCPARKGTDDAPADDPEHQHEKEAAALIEDLVLDASAAHPDVRLRRTTVEGAARKVLVDRSAAADLVVLGARRRSGRFGFQLGRVSHTLLHHAACPVAVVPNVAPKAA